jgi:hypothetical protein
VLKPIDMHFDLLFLSWRIDIIWISIHNRLMSIFRMHQGGSSSLVLLASSVESQAYDTSTYFWMLETWKQKHTIWNESHSFIKSHKTLCSQKRNHYILLWRWSQCIQLTTSIKNTRFSNEKRATKAPFKQLLVAFREISTVVFFDRQKP